MKTKVMNAVDEAKKLYKQELDAGRKPVFTSIAETLFQQTGIKRTGKTISGWCKKYKWKEDYELKLDELSKSPKRKRGGQRGNKNGVSFKEYESWDIKDARSFMLKSLNWIKRSSKRINIAEFCIKEGYPSNALDFLSFPARALLSPSGAMRHSGGLVPAPADASRDLRPPEKHCWPCWRVPPLAEQR